VRLKIPKALLRPRAGFSWLAMISPSASRLSLTDPALGATGFPVFHRVIATEKSEGSLLYKHSIVGVTNPKIIIIDDNSSYRLSLSQRIKTVASTGSILSTISVSAPTSGVFNWTTAVNTVRTSAASVVIYAGYYPQAATLYTQLRNAGYKGVLAGHLLDEVRLG
jgi:branched-chain amino acid transport system substrate-binding protein